jgi:hypothetical protein
METAHSAPAHNLDRTPSGPVRSQFADAARFWEPRRLIYNAVLTATTVIWFVATWPHFRPALTLASLLPMLFLALLANVCYSAAYLVDVALQGSSTGVVRSRSRWALWVLGTLFALLLANYWIADEIYPDFH